MISDEELEALRAERDEWRRRAEVAEAVAAERLARAENAERALRAAEAALAKSAGPGPRPAASPSRPAKQPGTDGGEQRPPDEPKRPASLLERWRRYTETIN